MDINEVTVKPKKKKPKAPNLYEKLDKELEQFFFNCKVLIWCEPEKTRNKSFDKWIQPDLDWFEFRIRRYERTKNGDILLGQLLRDYIKEQSFIIRGMLYDLHFLRRIPTNAPMIYECGESIKEEK